MTDIKGRSRKQADQHYCKVHDAEVAHIRASVPDAAHYWFVL